MSVYMGITLTVAKGFEEKGGWYGREEGVVVMVGVGGVDVHIQQNKLRVGIKETKWVLGGHFDEHHLSGPVRLRRTPCD